MKCENINFSDTFYRTPVMQHQQCWSPKLAAPFGLRSLAKEQGDDKINDNTGLDRAGIWTHSAAVKEHLKFITTGNLTKIIMAIDMI